MSYSYYVCSKYGIRFLFLRLYKKYVTSNASRSIKLFKLKWYYLSLCKKLNYKKLSRSGKNFTGRTVVYSKQSLKLVWKKPKINYSYRYKVLSFISNFTIIPFENKFLALLVTYPNGLTYLQLTESMPLFKMLYFPIANPRIRYYFRKPFFCFFYNIKRLLKVCLLELIPGLGIQYVRSPGTSAKILKFNQDSHQVLIKLPSGVRKLFSNYSIVYKGRVAFKNKKLLTNTKSGFWRKYGVKNQVRGVAKNPVDHPHGGRTKSIKYPRTPWGKTTKFK